MRTEIKHIYTPRDGYFIDSVLPLEETITAVFTSKYEQPSFLDIIGLDKLILSIDLSTIKEFDTSNYYKCYFNLGEQFGMIHRAEELLLFDSKNPNDYEIIKILNPFKPDQHDRKTNAEKVSTFLIDNKILFGLADYSCYGFPPRYLTHLALTNKKGILGISKEKRIAKWDKLEEIPKNHFPETQFSKFLDNRDWLNIRALTQINNDIFIHSTGGTSTRLKSGNAFEYNIVAKFDKEFNWIKNFEIEKGIGLFSTEKQNFILHPSNNRNKLFFYSTDKDLELDFEISLNAKQNLGKEKATQIQADKLNDSIYIYNHRFLNICKLKK